MDQSSQEKDGESSRIHRPEFVLLDKEQPEAAERLENEYFHAITMLQKLKPSIGLQLVILLAIFFIALATLIGVFFFLINVLICAFVLFKNKEANKYLFQSWKNVKKLFAFLAGTLIGLFSPSLGLSLVILFMMQEKEPLNKTILSRLFKSKTSN
jgi:uncharacterized membrane protein